jgi:hypothetical protein
MKHLGKIGDIYGMECGAQSLQWLLWAMETSSHQLTLEEQ